MTFQDKTAIITGASRGIGRAIALALGAQGARVVVASKTSDPDPRLPGTIHDTVKEVEEAGGTGLAFEIDVRDEERIDALVAETIERFGPIDYLINNAGVLWWQPVFDTPARKFDLVMGVNARAAFLLSRAVATHMVSAERSGHIVMMSPPLDQEPHPDMVAYTISKFGMTLTAIGLAAELRPHGIGVNSLWPATMIESQATKTWQIGKPEEWRKSTIMADATLRILESDPKVVTGRQLVDEAWLRENGVTDFTPYQAVPGHEPPPAPYTEASKIVAQIMGRGSDSP